MAATGQFRFTPPTHTILAFLQAIRKTLQLTKDDIFNNR
jgi:hypothetical protein